VWGVVDAFLFLVMGECEKSRHSVVNGDTDAIGPVDKISGSEKTPAPIVLGRMGAVEG
jgi:hypothetical protein